MLAGDAQATSPLDLNLYDLDLVLLFLCLGSLLISGLPAGLMIDTSLSLDLLLLLVPLNGLIEGSAGPHSEEDLTNCRLFVILAYMDNLLSLEAVIFVHHLVERQFGAAELDGSCIWIRLAHLWLWDVEDINKDGITFEVLDVEVIDSVLEAEQGVVNRLKSQGHVSALSVVVIEVHGEECLDSVRIDLLLTSHKELIEHDAVECSRCDT